MKVRFVELPPSVRPIIEVKLGEEAEVVNMKKWQEGAPAMWLIRFADTTQAWLKPQYLEIINEEAKGPTTEAH